MSSPVPFTWKTLIEPKNIGSLLFGGVLLIAGFWAEHIATLYALDYLTRATSVYVGDLLLDNLPIINLNLIVVEGALWAIALSILLLLRHPRKILFTIKAVAIFIIARAFFISLTHVGIYPGQIVPSTGLLDAIYSYFNLQTGYFFSGHVALPFLMALIYWHDRTWRYVYLFISFVLGISVLLAHVHYSIDVFAAPFMAYGIFEITRLLFPLDFQYVNTEDIS